MDVLGWLQSLGRTADPLRLGFQPQPLYLVLCVLMPVTIGLMVGFGVRLVERLLGIERPQRGGH
ncbi:MAG TPA: hypothetical protein VEH53_09255 [archaeon]|nr:hypothetical protein [archaeon]